MLDEEKVFILDDLKVFMLVVAGIFPVLRRHYILIVLRIFQKKIKK